MKELQHKNIVKFFAVCLNPFGILIEFCTFDFELLFDRWSSINTLSDFLHYIDNFEAESFEETFPNIAFQLRLHQTNSVV